MTSESPPPTKPEIASLQQHWQQRQLSFGDTPRAVLLKGLPEPVNQTLDRWHRHVMHLAFADRGGDAGHTLDIGCGYGRLANEAQTLKLGRVVGIDFSMGFCRHFARQFSTAVCCDLSKLPFAAASFSNAYSVTSLMYLDLDLATKALASLDATLMPRARILLIEPGAEFNRMVRHLIPKKQNETLARSGFTLTEFHTDIIPRNWRCLASGGNSWTTAALPLLIAAAKVPGLYKFVARIALFLDKPRLTATSTKVTHLALHRWSVYERQPED